MVVRSSILVLRRGAHPGEELVMSDNHRAELAAFLRAQRSRLLLADVGLLPDMEPGRRRTPGLREGRTRGDCRPWRVRRIAQSVT